MFTTQFYSRMKSFTKGFKLYLSFFLLIFTLSSCDKEEFTPVSPKIHIFSAKSIGLTTFEIDVRIGKGEGEEIQKAEIILEDITNPSDPDIIQEITINSDQSQSDIINIQTSRLNHDFIVKAKLTTNKNIYESQQLNINSLKNSFDLYIHSNEIYEDFENSISAIAHKGDFFYISIKYKQEFVANSIEIKLNNNISLQHNLDFENGWKDESFFTSSKVQLPTDIASGIYEIYVYIDDIKFIATKKVRVPTKWEKSFTNYNGFSGKFAWFIKKDNLFIISSAFDNDSNLSEVWKYNITNNLWEQKKYFSQAANYSQNKIYPLNLQCNDDAFILIKNENNIELWKYHDLSDTWTYVSTFPGNNSQYFKGFMIDGKIYINEGKRLWEYNIEANYWQQKNDIPFDYAVDFTQNDKIFAFTNYRNFWEYQTESDCWIKKQNNLISSTHYANLVFYDQYIYLLSARYDNNIDKKDTDCWRYSIETDSWEYISTLPVFIWHGIAFTYNNKLYTGFDWYTDNQLPVYKLDLKSLDQ